MNNTDCISRFVLQDSFHGSIACTAIRPASSDRLPVCIFLFGGGGSADTLTTIAPLLLEAFRTNLIRPMVVACAGVDPFCFYLDDPSRGMQWESLVAGTLLERIHNDFHTTGEAGIVGISMGGYGALKMAFARPKVFHAAAAIAPMVEPSLEANAVPLRNRFHYPPDVPSALLGAERDCELYRRDHPGWRAIHNAAAIRESNQVIWLDAGSRDACHAHDGTEFMHRVLWQLDIRHEYHLHRDADHVGQTLVPRLESAFEFVGRHLSRESMPPDADELALRNMLERLRMRAIAMDATVLRTYGHLQDVAGLSGG